MKSSGKIFILVYKFIAPATWILSGSPAILHHIKIPQEFWPVASGSGNSETNVNGSPSKLNSQHTN